MPLVVGKAVHRTGMGQALGHLLTQRIEMAERRGHRDAFKFRGRLSPGSCSKWRLFESLRYIKVHRQHSRIPLSSGSRLPPLPSQLSQAVEPRPTYPITYAADFYQSSA